MSHSFTTRLRRLGAGTAAILLIAGASACGTGERDDRAERGERKGGVLDSLGGSGEGKGKGEREGEGEGNRSRDRDRGNESREQNGREERQQGGQEQRAGADNFDRRVRIINNSGETITLLHGSPTNVNDWGQDRIPTMTLAAGQATIVDFNDNNGECRYDLRATLSDGTTREQRNVNICQVSEWIVTPGGAAAQ